MSKVIAFNPIYLKENQGHGNARRVSLQNCRNELVALMDADDISLPQRFMHQLQRFAKNDALSIVGGQISEFSGDERNIIGIRKVPEKHGDICQYLKKRCPMNQVSVMFKKTDVENAGGYQDWFCEEDYYLWIRMMEAGCIFENVPEILVNVRAGENMSSRRGGWKYFRSERKLQKYMLAKGIITFSQYIYNITLRFSGEVILSNSLRSKIFKCLREDAKENDLLGIGKENEMEFLDKESSFTYPPFSVAICVYEKDNPEWFDIAMGSILDQTVKPAEIVLVVDGPIPASIQNVIDKYEIICGGDC